VRGGEFEGDGPGDRYLITQGDEGGSRGIHHTAAPPSLVN
jgi:hypothetical protein